jgi:hypothetical protein
VIKLLKTGTVNKYLTSINYPPSSFPSSSVSQIPFAKSITFPLKLKKKFDEFIKTMFKRAHIENLHGLPKPNLIKNLSDASKK